MTEEILTAKAVRGALKLYKSFPAATIFRGLTGFGLVVGTDDLEGIGPVAESKGVWKPMYFLITGGEKYGRRTISAEDIAAAIAEFEENPLWALLRVTTGCGLLLDQDMPKLVDIAQAQTQVAFELTHYGGRSIVPTLTIVLGRLMVAQIDWQGGFLYESEGNKPPMNGRGLRLSRVLEQGDRESAEVLDRVWQDMEKESGRLTLLNTDGKLPTVKEEPKGAVRAFLTQELTSLLPNTQIDQQAGYSYEVRRDRVVVVRQTIREDDLTKAPFEKVLEAFQKEAMRVYSLYCQPLDASQRQKLGKPSDQSFGLVETGEVEFERDDRRSTSQTEALIAWRGRNKAPHFPYEGWTPEKGKLYRVLCHRWGKGVRVSPAAIVEYVERWKDNGDGSASRVEIAIDYQRDEREVRVLETRQLAKQEGTPWIQSNPRVVWGQDLASSVIEDSPVRLTPLEEEKFEDGQIIWRKYDERKERQLKVTYSIIKIEVEENTSWLEHRFEVSHEWFWDHRFDVTTYDKNFMVGGTATAIGKLCEFMIRFGDMPSWWQKEQEARYIACYCGRQRRDSQAADGYAKCELCRAEAKGGNDET